MPRNAQGQYFLPDGNPVVPGELIKAEWANSTMDDIANALTESLDRSGFGGMTAPLKCFAGTAGRPGITFLEDVTSGLYKKSNGVVSAVATGVEQAYWSNNGFFAPATPTTGPQVANKAYVDSTSAAAVTSSAIDAALGYHPAGVAGQGATGTWNINISGNATYSDKAGTLFDGDNTIMQTWTGNNLNLNVDGTAFGSTWPISVSGNSATATTSASCSGNAATATNAAHANTASSLDTNYAVKNLTANQNDVGLSWDGTNAGISAKIDVTNIGMLWGDVTARSNYALSGYFKFPNGFIIQWGWDNNGGAGNRNIVYPIVFPTACFSISAVMDAQPDDSQAIVCSIANGNNTNFFSVYPRYINLTGGGGIANQSVKWMAIGY